MCAWLQARGEQLEAQTQAVLAERGALAAAAAERRAALVAVEEAMTQERARLDGRSRAERLRQISIVEEQYQCAPRCSRRARDCLSSCSNGRAATAAHADWLAVTLPSLR